MTPEEYEMMKRSQELERQLNPYGKQIQTEHIGGWLDPGRRTVRDEVNSMMPPPTMAILPNGSRTPKVTPGYHMLPDGRWMPEGIYESRDEDDLIRGLNPDGTLTRDPSELNPDGTLRRSAWRGMQRDDVYIMPNPNESIRRLLVEP